MREKITFKELRGTKGLTKKQVSDHLEISEKELDLYENNLIEIPASTLIKLRNIYNIPLDIIRLT